MINKGYLSSDRTVAGDEKYTPFYAVNPIIKYLQKDKTIWCPFDEPWSAYPVLLREHGFQVITSSIQAGQDFFTYEPESPWDIIISNPPFSKKDKVLKRLYDLGEPYALLLPLATLQGKDRYQYLKDGLQILAFDKRINFHSVKNMDEPQKRVAFASAYFCKGILPNDLILEKLNVYDRKLEMGTAG